MQLSPWRIPLLLAIVNIPYDKKDETKAIAVYFVAEDGTLTRIASTAGKNGIVTFSQTHWSIYAIVEETALPFTDVADTAWYYEAVRYAFEHKLFSGTSATSFGPEMPMNRAMLMTVLARLDGQDTTGGVAYYEKAMAWAVAEGISDGTNPEEKITREQLAAMLYRYAGSPETAGTLAGFTDADKAGSYAIDALRWTAEQGIIAGKGNGRLDPLGKATRAEVAATLMRYMEAVNS